MNVIHFALVILLSLALNSCEKQNCNASLSAEDYAKIHLEANRLLHEYQNQINLRGLEAEFEYLDSTTGFFWIPHGYNHPLNYDSVAFIIKKNSNEIKKITNEWIELTINPLSNEIVNYNGILNSKMTSSQGTESEYNMIESGILIKRSAGWKLLSGQTRIIDPPTSSNDSLTSTPTYSSQ